MPSREGSKKILLSKFKFGLRNSYIMTILRFFSFVSIFLVLTHLAKAEYLREDDLKSLTYSCYLDGDVPVFCSGQEIDDPHLKIYLPLFKSIMIDDKIHAFRIMATLENLYKSNIVGAKVKLKFKNNPDSNIEFIINERVKYKMLSTTNRSHLIRSDIPSMRDTYNSLYSAYYSADTSNFEMAITELHFD